MVYVYLVLSSALLFLLSSAASVERDANDGLAWAVLFFFAVLITILRVANLISKIVYKACAGERKKVTITDLMVFDAALYVLYGILTGLGADFSDPRAWCYLLLIGVPSFIGAVWSVIHRFCRAFERREERKHDIYRVR